MFVQRLNKGELTTWMKNQPSIASWDLFYLMRKWGDAVGEALSACEITEKEVSSLSHSFSFILYTCMYIYLQHLSIYLGATCCMQRNMLQATVLHHVHAHVC